MAYLKVKNNSSLVRDSESTAIINNSVSEYEAYISARDKAKKRRAMFESQTEEINNLKEELLSIKSMLKELLNK